MENKELFLEELQNYISLNYIEELNECLEVAATYSKEDKPKHNKLFSRRQKMSMPSCEGMVSVPCSRTLDDVIAHIDDNFVQTLFHIIDTKGYTDVEVYTRANIDRRVFSSMRCKEDYVPSKKTALRLCLALKLNKDESLDLLAKAGYTLSPSSISDVIVSYFIENKEYDLMLLDEVLYKYNQPLIGV